MAIVMQGVDNNGKYVKLRVSPEGSLKSASFREDNQYVAGDASTTGNIDAVAASATTIVAVDCSEFPVEAVDWAVSVDNSWNYQLARSNANALAATITLTDATAVDDGDTFLLNGVTWTAEATEEDVVAANHMYWLGANNAEAAVNLAAALSGAYGPGVTATASPVSATDVITINATTATVLQFAQGTSAANEIAWAETTKLGIDYQGALVTGPATTAAWHAATVPDHYLDGWKWGYLVLVNAEASTATLEVRATRR